MVGGGETVGPIEERKVILGPLGANLGLQAAVDEIGGGLYGKGGWPGWGCRTWIVR
jgi:hypothetical protein